MYCTVKEIIRDVLDTDVPDSECVFAVVLTRGDVRYIAQDWNLSDDELETVMQRLDDAFEYGADVSIVHDVVRELMEEKRASRQVTVPAVMLEKGHCCKVSDEAAFCLIQRPYISKTLLTRRISPRGSP